MKIKNLSLSLIFIYCFGFGVICHAESYTACSIREKGGKIEMTNPFCSLKFIPRGGACVSFVYRNKEFTSGNGMFEDLFWETPNYSQSKFTDVKYQYEILNKGPRKIVLRLWGRGSSGNMKFITYSKTITLTDNSSLIKVDYEISNLPESMGTYSLTPWIHNFLKIKGEKNIYYLPTENGIINYAHVSPMPVKNFFTLNASRGWTGLIGEKSNIGLATIVDFKYLKQFYNWFGKSTATVEWMMGPVSIKNGESFKTTFYLQPFSGIKQLDGVSINAVGEINIRPGNKNNILVKVSSTKAVNAKAILRYRLLPGGSWKNCGTKKITLKSDKAENLRFYADINQNGTYIINCTLLDEQGNKLLQMEQPFNVGIPSGNYKLKPVESKKTKKQRNYCALKLKEDIVFPHIPFAKPYSNGKIKSLFIIDTVRLREVIELAQRMDLKYTTPTLHVVSYWNIGWCDEAGSGWSDGTKEMGSLLSKAYDCILVSGYHSIAKRWSPLAAGIAEKILPKVKNGTGLIYIGPENLYGKIKELYNSSKTISTKHPLFASGFIMPGVDMKSVRVAKYGKGRIVFLDYPGNPIIPNRLEKKYWDYAFSFINKAMLWASNKEPSINITSCSRQKDSIEFKLENNKCLQAVKAQLKIRDENAVEEVCLNRKINLPAGKSSVSFNVEFGNLKRGKHFLDFRILTSNGKVINWLVKEITQQSPVWISDLKLVSDYCYTGDKIKASLKLNSADKKDKKISITASWIDAYGRLAQQKTEQVLVKFPIFKYSVSLDIDKSYSIYNKLIISIKDNTKKVLDESSKDFFIHLPPEKRWDNYPVFIWHHDFFKHYYALKVLKRIGIDSIFDYKPLSALKAAMNVHLVGVYRQHLQGKAFDDACKTMIRKPCLFDPEFRKVLSATMTNTAAAWRKYSPVFYSIGDENSLTGYENQCDVCVSKYCLPRFQKWLISKYGSLNKINSSWGTNFAKLEYVKPLNFKQVTARKNMNFSPWADHRTFMDTVFSATMLFCKKEMKTYDPYTAVGECGTSRDAAYGGWDWYKRMQVWDGLMPYSKYGDQLEIQRSFSSKPLAGYSGFRDGKFGLYSSWWWKLLNGEKGISLWYTPLFLNPDLTKTPLGEAVDEYANGELKKGIGKLIAQSSRVNDGIAIHYSQPSLQSAYILKNVFDYNTLKQYYSNRHQWLTLLKTTGLQYNFVASTQIENGELLKAKYKVLVLPLSRAMSDREVENIKRFVKNGGVLIADRQTALFDEHVKIRKQGALDSLFGLKRLGTARIRKGLELKYKQQEIRLDACDPVIKQGAAESYYIQGADKKQGRFLINFGQNNKKFAAIVINKLGRGKTIYLNMLPNSLKQVTEVLRTMFIKEASVKPEVTVCKDGMKVPGLDIARFKRGDIELIGIIQMPEAVGVNPANVTRKEMLLKSYPAEIRFSRKAHIYNVRKGKYCGFANQVMGAIAPGEALVYALVPYRIDGLELSLKKNSFTQGETIELQISRLPEKGSGVMRVEIFDPEGSLSNCYTSNINVQNGKAFFSLKTAINDKTGRWKILVKDIISGKETARYFEIKTRKKTNKQGVINNV